MFTITASCSLTRTKSINRSKDTIDAESVMMLTRVAQQNITQHSFYITKAEIEILSDNRSEEFLASIKFSKPDKYLISLKSKAGIEAVRILVTNDTILVNDRFNRTHYYGSAQNVYRKYRISNKLLSLIFGDYVDKQCIDNEHNMCENNVLNVKCTDRRTELNYQIDCKKEKVKELKFIDDYGRKEVEIAFTDFFEISGISIPGKIYIAGLMDIRMINITLKKVELPWEGNLDFVPGNKYQRIEIL